MVDAAEKMPVLRLTRDLSVVSLAEQGESRQETEGNESLWDRLDNYLYSHGINLVVPRELAQVLPTPIMESLPQQLTLPLAQSSEGRTRRSGLLKKVIFPFLLGLKFKTTAVVPLALALIALKTWKALTLGLLSIVLSGAMVIFRMTRPKVSNLELYYPPPHHHIDSYDHHYAAKRAYSAQMP